MTFKHASIVVFILICFNSLYAQSNFQNKWLEEFNKDKLYVAVLDIYHKNAGIDYDDGFVDSRNDIYASLINLKASEGKFSDYKVLGSNKDSQGNYMEIGTMKSAKSKNSFIAVSAWRNENGNYRKEAEYIRKQETSGGNYDAEITNSREKWVYHSNRHDPAALVNEIYTENAQYYNNGELSTGRAAVTERYSYMSSKDWSITLTPLKTVQVNNNLVFEIGTYLSNGSGQYMLIWQKQKSGKWQVMFDFNF